MSTNVAKYQLLDQGYTATIYRIPGLQKVCKSFLPSNTETNFPVEVAAYERFTEHSSSAPSSILKYFGIDPNVSAGIILELASNGNIHKYIWDSYITSNPPSNALLCRWARQAAEGLAFAHSCGVLNSDIHCVNFLLDENLNLKVSDFAGASIDGRKSWSSYRLTHQFVRTNEDMEAEGRKKITIETEIFAFGSALYYLVTGHDLYPELDYTRDKREIISRLGKKQFPDVSNFSILGSVISKCWNLEYRSMEDIIDGIDTETESL